MAHQVTLIPGDGIGPEVIEVAEQVLAAAGVSIDWHRELAGISAIREHGVALPKRVLDSIRRTKVALKGPTETPVGGGHRSVNVELRQTLEAFANVRPVRSLLADKKRKYDLVDLVIIRENTEDLFCGAESMVGPGMAVALKVITEKASTLVARYAFQYARQHGRSRITVAHKANIMKLTDGLFLSSCRAVAEQFPEVRYDEVLVDSFCAQLVMDPGRFDMILTENLYGDIISDLCAGFVGGLGLACGGNMGHDVAIFEAVHGSAPDIAGKGLANPSAIVLSAAMMLDYLGEAQAAARVRHAVSSVLIERKTLTGDLGGTATTREFADALLERLR